MSYISMPARWTLGTAKQTFGIYAAVLRGDYRTTPSDEGLELDVEQLSAKEQDAVVEMMERIQLKSKRPE
jgi:hypothetical protein